MSVVAIVPAAGRGERLGAERPKALVPLAGRPVVAHAVAGLRASGVVDRVVVAAPADGIDEVRAALDADLGPGDDVDVVAGGVDRVDTVARVLTHVPADARVVLVHDAARCLCPPDVVRRVVDAVHGGHQAVVPALPVADTLKRVDAAGVVVATVDRTGLAAVQTPQGFSPAALLRAHEAAAADRVAGRGVPATDDAGLVEAVGGEVTTVAGDPRALKITTPLDLALAEALLVAGPAGAVGETV